MNDQGMQCPIIQPRKFTPHGIKDILKRKKEKIFENKRHFANGVQVERWFCNKLDRKSSSKPKKQRTTFTMDQLCSFEKIFNQKKYINSIERNYVSRSDENSPMFLKYSN